MKTTADAANTLSWSAPHEQEGSHRDGYSYQVPPPAIVHLTRQERAAKASERNVFVKYGDKARAVLDALLRKSADRGITSGESFEIFEVDPLTAFGTPVEVVKLLGEKHDAIRELATALYQEAA